MTIKTWFGQSTTGVGIATLLASLGAILSGGITLEQAVPLVIGGLAGVIWPENAQLSITAEQAAKNIEHIFAAYEAGLPEIRNFKEAQVTTLAAKDAFGTLGAVRGRTL